MLHRYLSRLYDMVHSRGEIKVEHIQVKRRARLYGRIVGRLRFYDGSILIFGENLELDKNRGINKVYYKYQYQRADGTLIFRYDNAPHHPEIVTYPDHLHVGERIEAAEPPDLGDVLRRIDELLYSTGQQDNTLAEAEKTDRALE